MQRYKLSQTMHNVVGLSAQNTPSHSPAESSHVASIRSILGQQCLRLWRSGRGVQMSTAKLHEHQRIEIQSLLGVVLES